MIFCVWSTLVQSINNCAVVPKFDQLNSADDQLTPPLGQAGQFMSTF